MKPNDESGKLPTGERPYIKLQWREKRIALGFPPEDSSPARQKVRGINVDETLTPRKSEGEKLRE